MPGTVSSMTVRTLRNISAIKPIFIVLLKASEECAGFNIWAILFFIMLGIGDYVAKGGFCPRADGWKLCW